MYCQSSQMHNLRENSEILPLKWQQHWKLGGGVGRRKWAKEQKTVNIKASPPLWAVGNQ